MIAVILPRFWRLRPGVRIAGACGAMLLLSYAMPCRAGEPSDTHPLMPGLRSRELNNPSWPRTLHDNLASGFSPLNCGMNEAPKVWGKHDFGGQVQWVRAVPQRGRADRLLVCDRRLRLVDGDGTVLWTSAVTGSPAYIGNLMGQPLDPDRANPTNIVLTAGPRMMVLDAESGAVRWSHDFDPSHVEVLPVFADILPELPGLEAAYALQHGEDGGLIRFPPHGEPRFVWQGKLIVPGEYDERYDHHCSIRVDLSEPQQPMLWNVRRYRCRGFDARTGKMVSSLAYAIGGEQRRNYGPWEMGHGKGGRPLAVVTADRVQIHAHAIRLHRDGPNELAWQHYYGEVYKDAFGVALENLAIADLDHDGETEVAYSVRDPERNFRSFVVVRDADTGEVEWELPDHWGVSSFRELGSERSSGLIVLPAPVGAMPTRGDMAVYRFVASGKAELAGTLRRAQTWGLQTINVQGRDLLLTRQTDDAGQLQTCLHDVVGGRLERVASAPHAALGDAPIEAVIRVADSKLEDLAFISTDGRGQLCASTWNGEKRWSLPLEGGAGATMSAADLDHDGRAELVAITPSQKLLILAFDDDGTAHERAIYPYVARWGHHGPLLYDLNRDRSYCLVTPETGDDGRLVVAAYRGDGTPLWKTPLDVPADGVEAFVAHGGQFLPNDRSAVAVSIHDSRSTRDGLFLLDGKSGELQWSKAIYRDGTASMPYRIHGTPTAFDYDCDGVEDIGIDMLSYMAYLRGADGSFAFVRHSPNIRPDGALYAGHLYNTFTPVFREPTDDKPHWFVNGGYGAFGVMNSDVATGIWRVDLGYDGPPSVGVIDVDGDGSLEVGYAAIHSQSFICRDFWTGDIEWELPLPGAPNSPCLTADVDGDGRGEFLIGGYCVGVDLDHKPRLRWQSPVAMGWAVIADFDGDGIGEIACSRAGGITVLKSSK